MSKVLNFISQFSEDAQSWQCSRREDSKGSSDGGVGGDAWEFRSAFEAPIARLESLDELEGSQVSVVHFANWCITFHLLVEIIF